MGCRPCGTMLARNVIRDVLHRTGPEQGVAGDEVFNAVGLHAHHHITHTARFKLKNALRIATGEQGIDLGIRQVELFQVD